MRWRDAGKRRTEGGRGGGGRGGGGGRRRKKARMNPLDKYSSLTDDVRTSPPPPPTYEYTDIISGIDSSRPSVYTTTTTHRRHS